MIFQEQQHLLAVSTGIQSPRQNRYRMIPVLGLLFKVTHVSHDILRTIIRTNIPNASSLVCTPCLAQQLFRGRGIASSAAVAKLLGGGGGGQVIMLCVGLAENQQRCSLNTPSPPLHSLSRAFISEFAEHPLP